MTISALTTRRARRGAVLAAIALTLGTTITLATASVSSASNRHSNSGKTVNLVAYSTPQIAYSALIKAFNLTPAGAGVNVTTSFGPSGQQAKAVIAGQPADVVNFSTTTDMEKLVSAGLVSKHWNTVGPERGMVTNSVVVFVVRKGNPLHIKTWADLVKKGVQLVTPNPFSSGSARWNLMAAYGAELHLGKSPQGADNYLAQLLKHAVAQPASASDAMTAFTSGTGNVLLDYEDDAIAAQRHGAKISYVIPPQTILIQNPIAVLTKSENNPAAVAFVNFLLSKKGQEIWAEQGYRPVYSGAARAVHVKFPLPSYLFNVSQIGGWTKITKAFFDPTSGIVTKIEESLGVSTSSG